MASRAKRKHGRRSLTTIKSAANTRANPSRQAKKMVTANVEDNQRDAGVVALIQEGARARKHAEARQGHEPKDHARKSSRKGLSPLRARHAIPQYQSRRLKARHHPLNIAFKGIFYLLGSQKVN